MEFTSFFLRMASSGWVGYPAHFFQIRKRARDRDPFRKWNRFSWPVHLASCVHLGTFETFYHMSPDDFEALFELLHFEPDPRAGENSLHQTWSCSDTFIRKCIQDGCHRRQDQIGNMFKGIMWYVIF